MPSNYVEEIHKTVISVDSESKDSDKTKRPAPEVPKKKKVPPKAPPKPAKLVRKPSVEEDVLKELDSILEHAFDGETIVEEDEEEAADTLADDKAVKRQSSSNSNRSSKTNSLNRNSDVFISETSKDTNDNTAFGTSLRSALKSSNSDGRNSGVYPSEPAPDYDVATNQDKSQSTGSRSSQMSQSFEQAADSGISEGSTEALDKKHVDQLSPNSLGHNIPVEDNADEGDDEEPDYENFATIQETLQRVW